MAPKMHSRVLGTQVGTYVVPGNSREFLSRFPSASFSQTFSLAEVLLSVGLPLLCARGIREAGMGGPWLCGHGSHDLGPSPSGPGGGCVTSMHAEGLVGWRAPMMLCVLCD